MSKVREIVVSSGLTFPKFAPQNSDFWAMPGLEDVDPAEYDEVMEAIANSKPSPADMPTSWDGELPF